MRYELQVTQLDYAAGNFDIIQSGVFEHNSNLKHGLQRKALEVALAEGLRETFKSPKWTNEEITVGGETFMMMHMTAFTEESRYQLTLRQVADEAEVTIETKSQRAAGEKHPFAVEIQEQDDGQLTVVSTKVIHAANQNAAKLQINGEYEAFDGNWSKMPYGGIYRTNTETGQIVVLRQLSAEEAAELDEAASE